MISETITFNFKDADQQMRFHAKLKGAEEEAFCAQVWGLALLAKTEIEGGDANGAMKTLGKIVEVASQYSTKE